MLFGALAGERVKLVSQKVEKEKKKGRQRELGTGSQKSRGVQKPSQAKRAGDVFFEGRREEIKSSKLKMWSQSTCYYCLLLPGDDLASTGPV